MSIEAKEFELKLKGCLAQLGQLLINMSVLEKNPQLTNIQKIEELKKIKEELNKVTLEIDSVKKGIKLLSTRHLN